MLPSLEREIRSDKKRRADEAAIKVFGENMKNLLLTPPIQGLTVLGFDPGFRTGCKLAIVDPTGKFLFNDVIYPTAPQNDFLTSEAKLVEMIKKYKVNLISCGNGTASRESEQFIAKVIKNNKLDVKFIVTSEAGASVYSASELAQKEYPTLDVTVRGAISIAHRVQDPLAELTKIDPKAIGVGQYQHDVDQKLLQEKLDEKVEDTVNAVGVDVNTASYTLLQYIAGLSEKVAKAIVEYRDEH
ncbi:MAG: helix-hairpin-helix domain-containing protein [Candidatus Peribacteria bacterium]|nr:helix-hairpin-helix domain-containing protein [Candidatus Peribacteria bacterium]